MPTTMPERELARLRARCEQCAQELARVGFLLKGSVLRRFKRCSSPGCACHTDPAKLHGPYWQWTTKVKGKTVTHVLSEEQASRYQEWIENGKRADQIVQELYDLSARANRILRAAERPRRKDRGAPRRRSRS